MTCENEMTAVVVGARGGVGAALVEALQAGGRNRRVIALSRASDPPLDLLSEASIAAAAESCGDGLDLVVDATGFLHGEGFAPERSWRQLDPDHMARAFAVNAIGPALLMKHFLPRLARDRRAVFATLSARVGSIEDNRLGGWYAYRASKAALNQLMRTASIELRRQSRQAICVSIHPGTVATDLSAPFAKTGLDLQAPDVAASRILAVLDGLQAEQSGGFFDHHGVAIAF
jgi:NAD(P)-dependent dehydrogenase (short-subunit alcohol dehydrogenase family)